MYCHECGAKAFGRFCSQCGAKLAEAGAGAESTPSDWAREIRYDVLMRCPEVRDMIARHASQVQSGMSANDFLKLADKAFVPLFGLDLSKLAAFTLPVATALGVKTGKERKETFAAPPGKVLVAVLCSLAHHGQPVNSVEQAQNGCLIKAAIPSDMWSFSGELAVSVNCADQGASVEAATSIKGQLFDWGKSKRILRSLFDEIRNTSAQ